MRFSKGLILLLFLVWGVSGYSTNTIKIYHSESQQLPLSSVQFYIDTTDLSITEASRKNDLFKTTKTISFEENQFVWGHFKLQLPQDCENEIWFLEFIDSKIDHIEFYEVQENGNIKKSYGGDNTYHFKDREILYHNSCFPISLKGEFPTEYYFKVASNSTVDFTINLSPHKTFIESAVTKYHLIGIFFGALFIVFLIVLGQIIIYKQLDLFMFLSVLIGMILLFLTFDNFGFHYVWTGYPFINEKGFSMSMLIFVLMQSIFLRKFLDSAYVSSVLDNILIGFMVVRVLIYSLSNFSDILILTSVGLDTFYTAMLLFVTIGLYLKKHDLARFVILSLIVQVTTLLITELSIAGVITNVTVRDYGFQFGFTLAMVLYVMAIMDKIRFSNVFFVDENEDIEDEQ